MPLLKLPGRSSIITVQICPAMYWCLIFLVCCDLLSLLKCGAEELGRALSFIVFPWKNPALVLTSKGSCLSCGKVAECYFELEVHAEKQLSSLISTSECHSKWRETLHWLEGWLESGPTRSIILQPIDFQTHFPSSCPSYSWCFFHSVSREYIFSLCSKPVAGALNNGKYYWTSQVYFVCARG